MVNKEEEDSFELSLTAEDRYSQSRRKNEEVCGNIDIAGEINNREDLIDLLLPELCFLFRIAGIPVKKKDPVMLNVIVFVFMWTIQFLMIGVYLKKIIEDDNPRFADLVEVYWALHSCVIYTILSHAMRKDCKVFQMILLAAESDNNEWRSSQISSQLSKPQHSLRKLSRICVFLVLVSVVFNISMLAATRFEIFLTHLIPWSDSFIFNLVGVFVWYFYSFHWFISIVCVYLPVHFFSKKVKEYILSLENSLTLVDRGEVVKAMEWYDDLYKVNKLMNFEGISLLTTTSLMMLMLLLIGLLLSVVKDSDSIGWPTFFWIASNLIVIACLSFTVAELETANKKILISVASVSSIHQFNPEEINQHQMMLLKINSLPFGIYVFGTRKLITFDFLFALVSILGSMFLFLIGINSS